MLCLASISIYAQEVKPEFDGHKWEAPYLLPIPKDWTVERFLIPISFAPQISYKGVEDIRFAPGWANVKSEEYWTYAFLWYLDNPPKINADIIAGNLSAYYTGLIKINTDTTKYPAQQATKTTTAFKKISTHKDDLETYAGTIKMLDYMMRKPITLNCIVHLKLCKEGNKTILFYELSPKPFTHSNWVNLDKLWLDFRCDLAD